MALRLYCDQDSLNEAVVRALRVSGIDVVTAPEVGRELAKDPDQLAFATAGGRTIYTANRADFARLHSEWMAAGRDHGGIIVRARQQISVGDQVRALRRLCSSMEPDAAVNRLEYLEMWLR